MIEDANKALAAEAATKNTALDAIEVLESDHRTVEKLFDAFEKTTGSDLEAKGTLAQRACELLTVHTIIEEEILYPAARKALAKSDEIDVDEAYVEHFLAKTLIGKFNSLKPGDHGFDATFKVLSEMVRHHIEEEESSLFPELRESGVDLVRLGDEIAAQRETLMHKLEMAGSKLVGDNSLTFRQ
ncbi:cation-binding protein [Paraburkholderia steynii]|uniref:Cation-binding protein n=1 Tax=Paraburkholderia steynii TaxID=1245441 RepID=A0A4R0XAB3_9BURK|nr:cation-binding protein [Paraburkholderia steynii]